VKVTVFCHAGYRGEETPRKIRFENREVHVTEVMDRWLAPDHRYFKIRGDDQGIYILRHDPHENQWEITFYSIM
jgi:hypothetical protein